MLYYYHTIFARNKQHKAKCFMQNIYGPGHVYRYAFLPVYIKMIYKSTIEFPFYNIIYPRTALRFIT